jgi:RNA 2',3'-cyclic 3'-phosphodiesterase
VRLFVALRPPGDVLDAVARLRRPDRAGLRWTGRDQWHVTLRFLGEVDDPAPVVDALDRAHLPPAVASLGPAVQALGRGVVMVPVGGVEELAAAVVAATCTFGAPPDPRPFRGHLTLARCRRGRVGAVVGEPVSARFPVADVRLVRSSRPGPTGPRYDDVHVRPVG